MSLGVIVSGRERCEVCSQNKVKSRPHCKWSTCVFFFLCCNEKKIPLLSIMKFSRLYFKDTMMLGKLSSVEYLQTIVLSNSSFPTLWGLSSITYSFSRTHAPKKIFWEVIHLPQCLKKLPVENITHFEIFHCLDKKGLTSER